MSAKPPMPAAELLSAAYHGRRPSVSIRFEDFGLPEPVSVLGPALEKARRVVVALHGRGATAESILNRAIEISDNDPSVTVVAPQAQANTWYRPRYSAPRSELSEDLTLALKHTSGLVDRVLEKVPPERVVLLGFSQGACLAIELFIQRGQPLLSFDAFLGSGVSIGGSIMYVHASNDSSNTNVTTGAVTNYTSSTGLLYYTMDVNLVVTPVPHVGFTVSPTLDYLLSRSYSSTPADTTPESNYKDYAIGVQAGFLGWF